jgi:hypothetical protein
MPNYKAGQFIYFVKEYESTPYIIYGVDDDDVFAIAVKEGRYTNLDRIVIPQYRIQNNCFNLEWADGSDEVKIDGGDGYILRQQLDKNQKKIDKFRKSADY